MVKRKIKVLLINLIVFILCAKNIPVQAINVILVEPSANFYEATMKRDILCLMIAYQGYITDIERTKEGFVYIIMKSGKRIIYDDKKVKEIKEKVQNPDLQDMMEQVYPLFNITKLMPSDFNPGRIRVYDFFNEVYGGSEQQVVSNLTNVKIGYKSHLFNSNNKASEALQSATQELIPVTEKSSFIYSFVFPISGTFNYRTIHGTDRLSAHAYGIAIDLAYDKNDYWNWTSRKEGEKRLALYPKEIIRIFEKNNFIWGGKWGLFDILHFEYRPELILKSRYFENQSYDIKKWYSGMPLDNAVVEDYIRLIEEKLN
ncbi:hypothetical protein CPJCM30710_30400 [Clostridium polyendosporum]|uniref:Peptidase M15C domain-containing protein n=1 Tax=Clostridium polyendosporum TaxID=69208 RepID=A0A919VFJ6_9CLOT|nr:M15 family metallopeptidase [Clostridium polyendosporum]GIM30374.1 hypothetical protein CPJCM30710_30400 [Clostridium polyendosporum]